MDFGMMPPEINSGRMYAGPGPGSMLTAAAAWDALAAQLRSTAASYSSVISGLTVGWRGPSSAAMAAAAAPYAAWMSATAAQAEQAAVQARTAAAAYEAAFTATVPPPVVAANRSQLAALVATNILGQNAAAIAATEVQYADMWAQDAVAMYGYAGSSAAATQLMTFTPPPRTPDPSGLSGQAAAVAQATGIAPTNAQSAVSQLMAATPRALQSVAAPAAADPPSSASSLATLLSQLNSSPLAMAAGDIEFVTKGIRPANDALLSTSLGLVIAARTFSDTATALSGETGILAGGLGSGTTALASAGSTGLSVSANVGGAGLVGAVSVPPSWAAATPTIRLAASMLQGTSAAAVPAVSVASTGSLFGQMGMGALAGGALGAALPRAVNITRVGGGERSGDGKARGDKKNRTPEKLKRVLAEMSQDPDSLQHWYTDKAHLDGLLEALSKKPGYHAVHLSSADKPGPSRPTARWG